MFKISLKYAAILGAVALICTALVASVQVVVTPIIAERTIQKVRDNLHTIFSQNKFEYQEVTDQYNLTNSDAVDALYKVTLADKSTDYVYEMSPKGRNADILFLLAFNTSGQVLKIQYVKMRETKGRGDKITKDAYLSKIYSQNASTMSVDLITGATYSTKAMKQSIEFASHHLLSEVLK